MAREALFKFEEERRLVKTNREEHCASRRHVASVNAKHGYINFAVDYANDKKLDGTYLKFYADVSKKTIGWKILREKGLEGMKGYRKVTVRERKTGEYTTTMCQLHISALLGVLNLGEKSFKRLPIKTYTSPGILSEPLDYIALK